MRKIAIAAVLLSLGAAPVMAGMTEGKAALEAGDYTTAVNELKPIAEAGDASAQALLAQIYLGGHGGSANEAMALLNAAANQGDPQAQAQLGLIYATGKGAAADNMKAYQWFALAAKGQQAATPRILAETNRDAVAKRLSASERAQAETLIASWQPSASQTFASAGATTPEAPATETAPVAAAPVETPAATPTEVASAAMEPAATETAAGESPAGIRIQLASVPGEDQAAGEWKRLQRKYASALGNLALTVETADLGTKGVYHRVQAGPFADKASAKAKCAELKAAGAACLVVVR
jgi:cell division septation protein DedD